ncbi:DMT family transporter [Roseiterribacter gracilis]|uniref:MFS transporter n=1 Tax=Roseiterribacter gracilis TaxID=2812848 RepID=A0A8S8XAB5_9PROT|nr:MFS transporter [Rhodospirillales bacterium TMPK1]
MSRLVANLLLLLAATIWGAAFVAQTTAMASIGPLWFIAIRFALAAIVVAPFALREGEGGAGDARSWRYGAAIGVFLFLGALVQQIGLLHTTVTNGGFLTSLYVLTTPVLGFLLFREMPHRVIWPGAALALAGTWLLGGGLGQLNWGDALITIGAIFWGMQILLLGRGSRATGRPLLLSVQQFAVTAALGLLVAALFEPISVAAVRGAAIELLYAGVLSGGLAFALQAVGQRHTPNADAAIILSAEAPLASLFGILLLGERVSAIGAVGCTLIFAAILLVQLAPEWQRRRNAS